VSQELVSGLPGNDVMLSICVFVLLQAEVHAESLFIDLEHCSLNDQSSLLWLRFLLLISLFIIFNNFKFILDSELLAVDIVEAFLAVNLCLLGFFAFGNFFAIEPFNEFFEQINWGLGR
jgi:hypothetical protein